MLLCGVDLDVLGTFLTTPFLYFHDCVRIDPGNAFRLVVKSEKFKTNLEYGLLDMGEMWHEWWVDLNSGYNLEKFMNDMASKIIWGPSQTIAVWSVDTDSAAEWRIRKDEHFDKMIQSRLV